MNEMREKNSLFQNSIVFVVTQWIFGDFYFKKIHTLVKYIIDYLNIIYLVQYWIISQTGLCKILHN